MRMVQVGIPSAMAVVMVRRSVYPSATSSAIMMLKPTAKASVPRLECLPWDISGISSSTTT